MTRTRLLAAAAAAALATLCLDLPAAHAQSGTANRAWVSGHGADAAGCGATTAPCRTFQYALDNSVAPSGEIDVLDPAGYGAMTISHAVSIVNDGAGTAGVQATSGDAITIAAGTSDAVLLRGLTIEGLGVAANGVTLSNAGALNIQNCLVRGFTSNGLNLVAGAASVHVSDTIVSDYANSGVYFAPTASAAAFYERVQALGKGYSGFLVDGERASSAVTIEATAADSVATGNYVGFFVNGNNNSAIQVTFMAVNAKAFDNSYGVTAQLSTMILAQSMVYGNLTNGFTIDTGGTIRTFGNNYIADANNSGSLAAIQPR